MNRMEENSEQKRMENEENSELKKMDAEKNKIKILEENSELKKMDDEKNKKIKMLLEENSELKKMDDEKNKKIMLLEENSELKKMDAEKNKIKILEEENSELKKMDDEKNKKIKMLAEENSELKKMDAEKNKEIKMLKKMDDEKNEKMKILEEENSQLKRRKVEQNTKIKRMKAEQRMDAEHNKKVPENFKDCLAEAHSEIENLKEKIIRLQKQLDDALSKLKRFHQRATSALCQTYINPNQELPPNEHLRVAVQETNGGSHLRLSNPPPEYACEERRMYYRYLRLVLILSQRLRGDTQRFNRWARERLARSGIDIHQEVRQVFVQLDDIGVIRELDQAQLIQFLHDIQRNDLGRLVRQFQRGNYRILYQVDRRSLLRMLGNPANQAIGNGLQDIRESL